MIGLTKEEEDHADDDHGTTDDHGSSSTSPHDDHAATASRGYDHGRRWLAGDMGEVASDAYGNTGSDGETMFIVSGWLMLALAVFNYFLSRWVALRLLKKAGCEDTHEYHNQLAVIEKQTLEAKVSTRRGGGERGEQEYLLV